MRAVILGLGLSGIAVAHYLTKKGFFVIGVDRTPEKDLFPFPVLPDSTSPQLDQIDLLVKSPGIANHHPWVLCARNKNIEIVGEIDLALAELTKKNKTILAITGSNGKTTTSLMCAHLLNHAGHNALVVGNIGVPLITQIDSCADILVLELSSFQLQNLIPVQAVDRAAILNITPNHLDYHTHFEEYKEAKFRISLALKKAGSLVLGDQVFGMIEGKVDCACENLAKQKEIVATILSLSYRDSQYYLFPHDVENIEAAFALSNVPPETLKEGIKTFVKPPHRLEFVAKIAGLTYINDSKATSIDAVIKAIEALSGPIFLIAGGVDKGGSFREWLPYFEKKVLKVFALGEAAQRIKCELEPKMNVEIVPSLKEAVDRASQCASSGSNILLSPGCSSYDQFKDYQQRGETFRKIVEEKL